MIQGSEDVDGWNVEGLEDEKAAVPFIRFGVAAVVQLAIVIIAFRLCSPAMFGEELRHPLALIVWTIGFGLPLSLFEYLYHRYLLHSAVLPFMSVMHRSHATHHALTNVTAPVRASNPEGLATVKNEYPVEDKHQEKAMMFPVYSGVIFEGVFLILLGLPIKLLFPGQPILLALIASVMLYYSAYEIWHAILHFPFESFWRPRLERPLIKRIYGFHLMHHWRPTANQAIVGFWGVALWDHLFRTHHRPGRLPLHDEKVSYRDAQFRTPRWPISIFDRWQGKWSRTSRQLEAYLRQTFLKREG